MADDKSHNPDQVLDDGDTALSPQISFSDELLLDQDEGGDTFDDSKKEDDGLVQDEDDPDLEAIRAKVKEMQEEQQKLMEMQGEVDKELQSVPKVSKSDSGSTSGASFPTAEEKLESDGKSVFVGNVDYSATAEELGKHFEGCGPVNRVTIMCDKYSGNPKGFAYVEFTEKDSVDNALKLDESLFKGRQLKVKSKRTNRPGLNTTTRGSRFRGRGRGYSRGSYFYPMFLPMPSMRGRGRAMRRSRSNWYAPY